MTYNNYRLIINGITITNDLVQKGSYKAIPTKRVVATWLDANLIEHQDILPTRKMDITFSSLILRISLDLIHGIHY